jgi:trk system potassium uptake protein TrkA
MVEITMGEDSPVLTRALRDIEWPPGAVLTGIIRDARPIAPDPDETIEQGDELLFLVDVDAEAALRDMLAAPTQVAE